MEFEQIQLTSKEILEKSFKTGIRGYNQEEVDQFLDVIIQDYENFTKEIERLKVENERLKKQSASTSSAASTSAGTSTIPPKVKATSSNPVNVNYDILKRLSNLEKAVFGKRYDS